MIANVINSSANKNNASVRQIALSVACYHREILKDITEVHQIQDFFYKLKSDSKLTPSDSFTSSLLSYSNTPLTAVRICYHQTYNRVMAVCACMVLHLHYHIVFFVG